MTSILEEGKEIRGLRVRGKPLSVHSYILDLGPYFGAIQGSSQALNIIIYIIHILYIYKKYYNSSIVIINCNSNINM